MVDRNKSSMDYTSLGCCALAFVLYLNTLNAGFVYDDRRAILTNSDVSSTTSWMQAFQNDYWGTPLTDSGSHGSYRPLCVLTFKANYLLGGYTAWGYHLINNLMHCLATGLVVKLARHLLSSVWGTAATGAIFAAHPIHTEAVAGIVGRADLAACVCYLLTYLMFIKHINWRERNDNRQWLALSCSILISLCAVLFKETAITALLVCGIFDLIRGLCGYSDKNRYRTVGILAAALFTIVYVRLSIPGPKEGFSTADNPVAKSNSIWTRFYTFLYLPVFNFKLLLYPSVLSFDWGMDAIPRITTIFDLRNLLSISFYATIYVVVRRSVKIVTQQHQEESSMRQQSTHTVTSFPRAAQQRKSRTKKKQIMATIINHHSSYYGGGKGQLQQQSTEKERDDVFRRTIISSPATLSSASGYSVESCDSSRRSSSSSGDCVCKICKQELTTIRHTSSCRAINNNNVPGSHTECGCLHLQKRRMYSDSSALSSSSSSHAVASLSSDTHHTQQQQQDLRKLRVSFVVTTVPSSKGSPAHCRAADDNNNNHTNNGFTNDVNNVYSKPHTKSRARSRDRNCIRNSNIYSNYCCSQRQREQKFCQQEDCFGTPSGGSSSSCSLLSNLSPNTRNGIVLLMSVAFLTLPFLPATNLFFYVGFVVAERILYMPSVGYCLLVGFGIAKMMDAIKEQPKRRQTAILCMSLVLISLSLRTWKRNSDWMDEESLFRSAVVVNPPKALGNLGSVLSSQGRYDEAREVLLEAIRYRPNMADVHFNLGILHQNQQNFKSAVENFQRAIQFRPNLAVAYLNLGTSLIALGRCQEAVSVLKEATKVDGTGVRDRMAHENARLSSYLQLGSLYAEQGKLQKALAVYREALHTLPIAQQREVLYHRLGDIFARLQQWDEAERFHRAALDIQPGHIASHLSYGITLAKNRSRASEAELWFKRALKLAPDQASVHHHYAEFLSTASRNEEACLYRVRAAEISPTDYSLVVAAATALRLLDKKPEAEIWYRKAVQLRPNDARAHTNLGAILHLLGRTQNAADCYREALRLQPGDRTTLGNLAKLGIVEIK